jgi:hypothetical protein
MQRAAFLQSWPSVARSVELLCADNVDSWFTVVRPVLCLCGGNWLAHFGDLQAETAVEAAQDDPHSPLVRRFNLPQPRSFAPQNFSNSMRWHTPQWCGLETKTS